MYAANALTEDSLALLEHDVGGEVVRLRDRLFVFTEPADVRGAAEVNAKTATAVASRGYRPVVSK
jgi:hypothetical protein